MIEILTSEQIATRFHVSQAQIDACARIIGPDGSVFFQVSSASIDGLVYEVHYTCGGFKMNCTCIAANPPRDKYGMPLGPVHMSCWHRRAAAAVAFEYEQQERVTMAKEAEEAAAKAALLASHELAYERKTAMPLNGNSGFSLLKQAPMQVLVGHDITYRLDGETWERNKVTVLAPKGQMPEEWEQVCSNPAVVSAHIASTSQRNKQSQKRLYLATYQRTAVAVAAD